MKSRLRETSAGKSRLLDRIQNFRVEQTTKQHVTKARKKLSLCDEQQVEKEGGAAASHLLDWVREDLRAVRKEMLHRKEWRGGEYGERKERR